MFATSIFLAFFLATQASRTTTLLSISESSEEYTDHVPDLEKHRLNSTPPGNNTGTDESLFPPTHFQSTVDKSDLFVDSSDLGKPARVDLGDAETHPNMVSTPPGPRPDSKAPYRAKIAIRKGWFPGPRHYAASCAPFEFTGGIIQRVVGFGQYFLSRAGGLTSNGRLFGSLTKHNLMVFSEHIKYGQFGKGTEALKDQGFFGSKRLSKMKMEESANNTLAVVLAGERIVIHSFGAPALAAVLLRVKNGQYEPIMVNEDNMSVEGTLKSKDIIVVGVCETIWRGLSFPADKLLEDITTDVAEQLPYGMAVAAIIR
ncbi:hypothetical protein PSACC_00584 [Paramicrosporidium saccamoebae]|uniref:Uncharacterized protein n=1 Tax=Paramicrosporidium saccamoebae TaxID=1246581 RepID=A0A2H9TPB0_9FUNG|nr:hypothetical protein PSACC_00584 [Paramicrosporidium saccamoebae]